jgi:hypothetical protein
MNTPTSSKKVVFVALMAALGNVMFVASQTVFKTTQIALDLSHVGTHIAAIFGGPWIGLATGLLVGIGPGLYFGYVGGSLGLLGLIGLPVGKALTGFTVGYLGRVFKVGESKYSSWKIIPLTLLGYVPEAIFTALYFESLIVLLLPDVAAFFISIFGSLDVLVISILMKGWVEMALMSIFMGALTGNNGFADFMRQHFAYMTKRST